MGRAYLCGCSDGEREGLLERIRIQDKEAWPKTREAVVLALAHYRDHGCCTSFGDWQKDVNAIAAAFRPPGGRSVMVVSCGGPGFNLSPQFLMAQVQPQLVALVTRLQNASSDGL
jgi:DNA-binding IclR family transcriptional regulator